MLLAELAWSVMLMTCVRLVRTLRGGGRGILQSASVELMRQPHVGAEAETQGPGWGFGFGGCQVLVDTGLAATPQRIMAPCSGGACMDTVGFMTPGNT